MRGSRSQALVIDACVARSAGSSAAEDPHSRNSRELLAAVLEICHRMVHDANARGGFDNVTVVLLRVIDDHDAAQEEELEPTVDSDSTDVIDPTA